LVTFVVRNQGSRWVYFGSLRLQDGDIGGRQDPVVSKGLGDNTGDIAERVTKPRILGVVGSIKRITD